MSEFQGVLDLGGGDREEGYNKWVVFRQLALEAAAERLNLPLGHPTEVWLRGGIRLRGKLSLANQVLFIEEERIRELALVVDGVVFTYAEIESCVRVD